MKRRDFLKLMGLASSTTAISACGADKKAEKLIPYLVPPDDGTMPGVASYYKTTCTECPANCGVQVKVREELPVKLEGLPQHPVNNGALCVRGQASLTRLYHSERLGQPLRRSGQGQFQPISWEDALAEITTSLQQSQQSGRTNVYLAGQTTGTLSDLVDVFCNTLKVERLPEFEPYSHAAIKEANRLLFGRHVVPYYRISEADFLLSIGADLLETFVSPVSYASEITQARKDHHLAWQHVEPHTSLTGLQADERLVARPGSEAALLEWLLQQLSAHGDRRRRLPDGLALSDVPETDVIASTGLSQEQLQAMLHQLEQAENPLLIVGGVSTAHQSGLKVALFAGLIQWITGMTESTVDFSMAESGEHVGSMLDVDRFARRLQQNEIGVCFISRTDPVANTPDTYALQEKLQQAQLRIGLDDILTDTMSTCDIILPLSHTLESWGDAVPRKGIRNIVQPALKPILDTRTEGDILLQILNKMTGETLASDYQNYLLSALRTAYGEEGLKRLLDEGVFVEPTKETEVSLSAQITGVLAGLPTAENLSSPLLVVAPSIRTYDGRSSVLSLLSEIPDPLTTITYGHWISVSPVVAEQQGLQDKDEAQFSFMGGSLTVPIKVQPGLAPDIFMVQRGQINAGLLSVDPTTGETLSYLSGLNLTKTGLAASIPVLSGSPSQHGRGIIPVGHDHDEHEERHGDVSMYPEHEHKEYRWAMAIDLHSCTGCSACVAACYIENNVAVVGPEEHLKGREMSWLRIEPYYETSGDAEFLPMMCQQCDSAPCEPVCPVYATYHNPEGLNAQVYNRCVGTRYCSNNCPYKVRRFNWFRHERPILANEIQMANPDVSVRDKGIMEKCTFCVQRIRLARDQAKDEGRKIRDGDVTPACAQSCPTQAIVFGNILDENSRVYQLAHSDRAYRVLEHLGTRPAVHYLKRNAKGHEA